MLEFLKPQWMDRAACRGVPDWTVFFPGQGDPLEPAQAICGGCAVREDCLEYALANGEKFGVWGGLGERGRRTLARQRREQRRERAMTQERQLRTVARLLEIVEGAGIRVPTVIGGSVVQSRSAAPITDRAVIQACNDLNDYPEEVAELLERRAAVKDLHHSLLFVNDLVDLDQSLDGE